MIIFGIKTAFGKEVAQKGEHKRDLFCAISFPALESPIKCELNIGWFKQGCIHIYYMCHILFEFDENLIFDDFLKKEGQRNQECVANIVISSITIGCAELSSVHEYIQLIVHQKNTAYYRVSTTPSKIIIG